MPDGDPDEVWGEAAGRGGRPRPAFPAGPVRGGSPLPLPGGPDWRPGQLHPAADPDAGSKQTAPGAPVTGSGAARSLAFQGRQGALDDLPESDAMRDLAGFVAPAFRLDDGMKAVVCVLGDSGVEQHGPARLG